MENLKGKNIIERMNQLMKYGKEQKSAVKEGRNWGDLEYSIKAPDGKTYGILRDKTKFYIKESKVANPTITDFDFIGGVINGSKRHYSNYSHALNYLNLMIAEMNQKNPKAKAINLLECSVKETSMEESKKEKEVDEKTVLKVPKAQPQQAPAPAQPAPQRQTDPPQAPQSTGSSDGLDLGGDQGGGLDLGGEDTGLDLGDDTEDLGGEDNLGGDEDTKQIQKLTGKLGQRMRELDQPDNDLTKYVINSVMSALNLSDLEDVDQKKIMKKMKKKMSGEGEMEDSSNLDLGDDDTDTGDDTGLDFGDDNELDTNDEEQQQPAKERGMNENDAPFGEKKEPQNIKSSNAPYTTAPTKMKTESRRINKGVIKEFWDSEDSKDYYGNEEKYDQGIRSYLSKLLSDNPIQYFSFNVKEEKSFHGANKKYIITGVEKSNDNVVTNIQATLDTTQHEFKFDSEMYENGKYKDSYNQINKKYPDTLDLKSVAEKFIYWVKNIIKHNYTPTDNGIQESRRVNRTIQKYFELTPEETQKNSNSFLTESINKVMLLKEGKSKCKSIEQELALTKVLGYDNGFAIKTMKENVIIETGYKVNLGGKEYQKLIMVETTGKTSAILKDVKTKNASQYRLKDKKDYINFIKLGK